MATPAARIGVSGWTYPGWKKRFYAGVRRADWLPYCASRFTGIEVNASFYRLLKASTFEKWRQQTPASFAFAIKGHRYLTHVRRLKDPAEPIRIQRQNLQALGDKCAVLLWQLPANLGKDAGRLAAFAEALGVWPEARHAIEFRDASWFDDEVAEILTSHRIANCLSDAADWPMWQRVTTDLVYLRLHGHSRTYASRYGRKGLEGWARRIRGWLSEGREVHVYFDNDAEGAAPYDALLLMELAGIAPEEAAKEADKQ